MINFFKEMFSSCGTVSCKRVMGSFVLAMVVMMVFKYVLTEPSNMITSDIIISLLWAAATLLGVSNITSVWKHNGNNTSK